MNGKRSARYLLLLCWVLIGGCSICSTDALSQSLLIVKSCGQQTLGTPRTALVSDKGRCYEASGSIALDAIRQPLFDALAAQSAKVSEQGRIVEKLEANIADLTRTLDALGARMDELGKSPR